MASYEELRKEYVKLAKRADQQMVRLEALSHEAHFRDVLSWAYGRAAHNIESWEGKKTGPADRPRFNRNIPDNMKELKQRLTDVEQFLNSSTNTKRKIIDLYKRRVETINKNMETDLTWKEFADLTESGVFDEMKEDYGSSTTFDVIAELQQKRDKFKDLVKRERERRIDISEELDKIGDYNIVMKDAIQKELDKHGLTLLDMI